jgi:hypothetical protein
MVLDVELSHQIPTVDLVRGKRPYLGYGPVVQDSPQSQSELHEAAISVRHDLREMFGVRLERPSDAAAELDGIVRSMWGSGWDPEIGNVELFTRDFGLILIEAILELEGGKLIFRSKDNALHWSIFWPGAEIEAFPFHRTLKCMLHREGESMTCFVNDLRTQMKAGDR